jgi:hypothetical protein
VPELALDVSGTSRRRDGPGRRARRRGTLTAYAAPVDIARTPSRRALRAASHC